MIQTELVDSKNWNVLTTLEVFNLEEGQDLPYDGQVPDEVKEFRDNLLLNAGITRLLNLLIGAGGQAYDATHTRIGIGDSATAAVASQTDLQASTNKLYNLVSSATVSGQTVTWVATFASGDANYAWAEWIIDNGTTQSTTVTAPALNRRVAAMITKTSAIAITITVTITIS